jgi:hypothetical protein
LEKEEVAIFRDILRNIKPFRNKLTDIEKASVELIHNRSLWREA